MQHAIPTDEEVRFQLCRMLASKRFTANRNSARFLALVVEKAMKGEPIRQSIIGSELFPDKYARNDISDVRVTASTLREVLADYFDDEGLNDPVIISLPKPPQAGEPKLPEGKAYKPTFGYNPHSEAHKSYARGLAALAGTRLSNAKDDFIYSINRRPAYAEAYLALAHLELVRPLCPSDISTSHGRCDVILLHSHSGLHALPSARKLIASALKLNPNLWRAHILSGVAHCYMYEWDRAERAFAAAITIAPTEARNALWYLSYLTTINRSDEAIPILETNIRESPADAAFLTQYGFSLYVLRRYSDSAWAFQQAIAIDPQRWPAYIGRACALLAHQGPDEALTALGDAQRMFPRGLFFPGFVTYCLALGRFTTEAGVRESFNCCMDSPTSEVDRSLAYLGLRKTREAISALARACASHEPLTLCLHQWPIFDPLHRHKGFQAIIKQVGLTRASPRVLP